MTPVTEEPNASGPLKTFWTLSPETICGLLGCRQDGLTTAEGAGHEAPAIRPQQRCGDKDDGCCGQSCAACSSRSR